MNKLSELRQSKKLSQREVANALNISQSTLSQYERGGRGIDGDMLKKLCAFYGASADDILGLPSSQQNVSKLSDDAKEFLSIFSRLNDKYKIRLLGAAYAMLAEQNVSNEIDLEKLRAFVK